MHVVCDSTRGNKTNGNKARTRPIMHEDANRKNSNNAMNSTGTGNSSTKRHDCSADLVGHRAYRLKRLGVLERGGRRLVHAVKEKGTCRRSLP